MESKRSYQAPELRDHGSVEELTLAGGTFSADFDGVTYGTGATTTS